MGLLLWVGWLGVLLPGQARASVVSRLGAIYFYDPLTFDAGILQRGSYVRGGAGSEGGLIDGSLDFPFFREFSLRLGYLQQVHLEAPDSLALTWRVRMPVVEQARFGRLSSVQVVYAGSSSLRMPDPLRPRHELYAAHSLCLTGHRRTVSLHGQVGSIVRDEGTPGLTFGRLGVQLRGAWLAQLYRPPRGLGGMWTTSLSLVELEARHYGLSAAYGGEGQVKLGAGGFAVHFTHRSATYSLGAIPQVQVQYGPEGVKAGWAGLGSFSITYRTYLE